MLVFSISQDLDCLSFKYYEHDHDGAKDQTFCDKAFPKFATHKSNSGVNHNLTVKREELQKRKINKPI